MWVWKIASKTPYVASVFCTYMLAEGMWDPGSWQWGVAAVTFLILGLAMNYGQIWIRKASLLLARVAHQPSHENQITPAEPDEDEEAVNQNPGNHAAVIRLIVKTETVDEIESLFSNYINSPNHHAGYEIEVVAVYYWKKNQLLKDEDERAKWYIRGRDEIHRRHGFARDQFLRALSDAERKYPELFEDW